MLRELGGRERAGAPWRRVVMLNPIFWFDNVVWGQVDSFGVVFLLLGLRELWRDQPERSAIFTVIAAVSSRSSGSCSRSWPSSRSVGRSGRPRTPTRGRETARSGASGEDRTRLRAWERRTGPDPDPDHAAVGFLTAVALCVPFGLRVLDVVPTPPFFTSGLVDQIALAGGGYPYLTVNAYNAWALVPSDLASAWPRAGQWVCDAGDAGRSLRGRVRPCSAGPRDRRRRAPAGRGSRPSFGRLRDPTG